MLLRHPQKRPRPACRHSPKELLAGASPDAAPRRRGFSDDAEQRPGAIGSERSSERCFRMSEVRRAPQRARRLNGACAAGEDGTPLTASFRIPVVDSAGFVLPQDSGRHDPRLQCATRPRSLRRATHLTNARLATSKRFRCTRNCETSAKFAMERRGETRAPRALLRASFRRVSPVALSNHDHVAAPTKRSIHPVLMGDAPELRRDAPALASNAPELRRDAPALASDAPELRRDAPLLMCDAPELRRCTRVAENPSPTPVSARSTVGTGKPVESSLRPWTGEPQRLSLPLRRRARGC
jgi:hypothetical protein